MTSGGTRLGTMTRAFVAACLIALAAGQAAAAAGGFELFSPETIAFSGDVRAIGVNGERSWADDDFGKLRYGGRAEDDSSGIRLLPRFGEANIIWQPRFGWSLSGTLTGAMQDKNGIEA